MAAGDRNKKGKPTDYVIHLVLDGKAVCGIKNPKVIVSEDIPGVFDCKRCMSKFVLRFADDGTDTMPNLKKQKQEYFDLSFDKDSGDITILPSAAAGKPVTIHLKKEHHYGGQKQEESKDRPGSEGTGGTGDQES